MSKHAAIAALGLTMALAIAGCSSEQPTPTATLEASPTPVDTTSPSSPPSSESPDYAGVFAKGYPKVVKKSEVPSPISTAFEDIPGNTVVMVAPGVYTQDVPGVTPEEAAVDGAMAGYCAAVKKFNKKLEAAGYSTTGFTCW